MIPISKVPPRLLINGEGRFKLNTVSLRHQRESLLRLSLELIAVVNSPRPDDHLEFRSGTKEGVKHLIDVVPMSPEFSRRLGQLGRESAQLEHELREAERGVGQESSAGVCEIQA